MIVIQNPEPPWTVTMNGEVKPYRSNSLLAPSMEIVRGEVLNGMYRLGTPHKDFASATITTL